MYLPVWRELKQPIIHQQRTEIGLYMYLPVWRELKHRRGFDRTGKYAPLHVPSRLKGIETRCLLRPAPQGSALHVPSRLKGIETKTCQNHRKTTNSVFTCTFPFEGNWNDRLPCIHPAVMHLPTLHVPSRLKGIETHYAVNPFGRVVFTCTFPFEGNWNIEYGGLSAAYFL